MKTWTRTRDRLPDEGQEVIAKQAFHRRGDKNRTYDYERVVFRGGSFFCYRHPFPLKNVREWTPIIEEASA